LLCTGFDLGLEGWRIGADQRYRVTVSDLQNTPTCLVHNPSAKSTAQSICTGHTQHITVHHYTVSGIIRGVTNNFKSLEKKTFSFTLITER
jgi:hypothetical protein